MQQRTNIFQDHLKGTRSRGANRRDSCCRTETRFAHHNRNIDCGPTSGRKKRRSARPCTSISLPPATSSGAGHLGPTHQCAPALSTPSAALGPLQSGTPSPDCGSWRGCGIFNRRRREDDEKRAGDVGKVWTASI
ncbi:unnamed protein product [Urochloa humidicola]